MKKLLLLVPLALLLGAGCVQNVTAPTAAVPTTPTSTVTTPAPSPTPINSQPTVMTPTWKFPGVLPASEIENKQIRITTAKGDIVFKLYPQDAPKTVSNFVYLTKGGYYDGLTFHRREEGFVIQGGDPNGTGTGGPGYKFEDETVTRQYTKGIVAMANAGPNTNGSQFFIMLADYPLPPLYTIFGEVTRGQDVVDKIAVGDVMTKVTVEPLK